MSARDIEAISLDCYGTLIAHRDPRPRREILRAYLEDRGLQGSWDGRSLDVLFAAVSWEQPEPRALWHGFTQQLFELAGVEASAEDHQDAIESIFGPSAFMVYPEVPPILRDLREAGYRLAVLSNWPDGLSRYLEDLRLSPELEVVVTSAGEGVVKPDPRIFAAVGRRLALPLDRIVHVGDDHRCDVAGARAAGMQAVHLVRDGSPPHATTATIRSLKGLWSWLAEHGGMPRPEKLGARTSPWP